MKDRISKFDIKNINAYILTTLYNIANKPVNSCNFKKNKQDNVDKYERFAINYDELKKVENLDYIPDAIKKIEYKKSIQTESEKNYKVIDDEKLDKIDSFNSCKERIEYLNSIFPEWLKSNDIRIRRIRQDFSWLSDYSSYHCFGI